MTATGVTWDLSALFDSIEDPKIESTWQQVDEQSEEFAKKYRGKVEGRALTPAELTNAIKELETIAQKASKPLEFGQLLFAADASEQRHAAFMQKQMERGSAIRVKLMFFELELQAADDEYIQAALESDALASYRHWLSEVRKYSPYRLSETEEVLLEETANTGCRALVRLHEELTANHEFTYTDPESGEQKTMSQEEILTLLRDPDRAIRQAAADGFSAGLIEMERTIAFAYNTLLADKKLDDRLRGYEYPEQSRHLSNELTKRTVDIVMGLCEERGDLVERYYKVKRQILGLEELTHIDRYAPLAGAKQKVEWERARAMVLESFREFDPRIAERAEEFFDSSWIDAEPRHGKTGGAFCSYNTVDTHPVILLSYLDNLDDVTTLAHELGHGVHASLSREQSQFNFHGTLPLAELASIFAEMLVFENLVEVASDEDRLALYADKLEGIFASVHRQSAMFRFERRCHTVRREEGELSAERFGEIWQEEIQGMFGESLKLGEQHRRWWLYVGHFFFAPFYVYAYSFGELLTLALYQKAKNDGPGFADKYIAVLKLGGSKSPQELMGMLGVDLADRAFWVGGFEAIDSLLKEFEAVHDGLAAQAAG